MADTVPDVSLSSTRNRSVETFWNNAEEMRRRYPEDREIVPTITAWEWSQHQLRVNFTGPWRVHRLWNRDDTDGSYQLTTLRVAYTCSLIIYVNRHDRPLWHALQCTPADAAIESPTLPLQHLANLLTHSGLSPLAAWLLPPPASPTNTKIAKNNLATTPLLTPPKKPDSEARTIPQ